MKIVSDLPEIEYYNCYLNKLHSRNTKIALSVKIYVLFFLMYLRVKYVAACTRAKPTEPTVGRPGGRFHVDVIQMD